MTYPQLIAVAWPIVIANLSTPLLGLVDTAILGHLDSPVYMASVALGAQLMTLLFWCFGFLRMGTTGFTARALGAELQAEIDQTLLRALALAVMIALLLITAQHWVLPYSIALMAGQNHELLAPALIYTEIRIWSAPATLMTYAALGWLIGLQNSRASMWVLLCVNLTNIALDYLFIWVLNLDVTGAALASLIAEYLGLVCAFYHVQKQIQQPIYSPDNMPESSQHRSHGFAVGLYPFRQLSAWRKLLQWRSIRDMLNSSQQLFVRTLCLLFCFLFFNSQSAQLGTAVLAANAILLNLLSLSAHAMDGFAHAAEVFCGKAWGAAKRSQFYLVCRRTSALALATGVLCSLLFLLAKPLLISLYTHLPEVKAIAFDHYSWLAWLPLLAIWCYQLDGIFIGIGHTATMRNSMLMALFFVFLPVWWLSQSLGNHGLWLALWSLHAARTLFLAWPFLQLRNKPQMQL